MATDFDVRSQTVITEVDRVPSGDTIQSEISLIAGKADPFATIDVHDGATLLGVVSANGEGNWMLQLSTPLFDGIHDLSAVQVTEYGVRSATSYFAVTVEASAAARTTHEDAARFAGASRMAGDEAQNGPPFSSANLFDSHAAPAHAGYAGTDPLRDAPAVATPLADAQSYARQTAMKADGGKGFDMVAFLGDHLVLDLSALTDRSSSASATGIGGFDLGGHHNALKMSLADVLTLGDHNLFIDDGKQQLIVNGKDGDSVDLTNSHVAGLSDGDWQHHGTTEVGGVTYNVVEHSTARAELLVEQAVRIEVHWDRSLLTRRRSLAAVL